MAVTHFRDPEILVRVSADLGDAMAGLEISKIAPESMLQQRGW